MNKTLPKHFHSAAEIIENGDKIVLKRFRNEFSYVNPAQPGALMTRQGVSPAENVKTGAVLDVETTGLDRKNDVVIEVGLRLFRFDPMSGKIASIGESYSGLQDPGRPLSAEIEELTGITTEDLRGQSIDWERVNMLLAQADLVIAHNAAFDRPFLDRSVKCSSQKIWGCSLKQIDWWRKGFPTSKLEVLCMYHGFYTAAHRALNDVDALLHLLSFTDEAIGKPYLAELASRADQPFVHVLATGSPFETKDQLKARGYRWDGLARVWQKMIPNTDLGNEVQWLENQVYGGKFRGQTRDIPVTDNFKE